MQTNNILSATLIDLIFDGHNKEYGAYELRKNYSKRIQKALLITMTLVLLIFGGALLANSSKKNKNTYRMGPDITLTNLSEDKKPDPPPVVKTKEQPVQTKTVVFTPPVIAPVVDVPPPQQSEVVGAKIGLEPHEGIPEDGISKPDNPDDKKGIFEGKKNDDSNGPISIVEIDAKFSGNWKAFLERNLRANVPVDNGAPAGDYPVVIRFVVDIEGNVSDIVALSNNGYGMEAEAVRVLKKAAKWEPAIQNGVKVKAYRRQLITFQVTDSE